MQQYNRLKTHSCIISVFNAFVTMVASRAVNQNVNTGAVIRAKRDTDRAGRS